jgi:hypothetical protein
LKKFQSPFFQIFCVVLFGAVAAVCFSQKTPQPTQMWSVGPLVKSEPTAAISIGKNGAVFAPSYISSQRESTFRAIRSVAFAGDRIILVPSIGVRKAEGSQQPISVYRLLSLDLKTGAVRESREFEAFRTVLVFAAKDNHIIVSGRRVLRLTPDLKDDGFFDYGANGHKYGEVENISPDGSTLGNATRPGYELMNSTTLNATSLTAEPSVDTSVNDKGYVTNNVLWIGQHPKDTGFVTYTDSAGSHMLYHGNCGGRPQFLTNDLILEPGCTNPLILDVHGNLVRTISTNGQFSYAGVSQNGKHFALQLTKNNTESFVIYSVESGEPVAEVQTGESADGQSWTAFSPDGAMFVVGTPLKLTLYHLP